VRGALIAVLAIAVSVPGCRRAAQQDTDDEEPPIPVLAEPVRIGTIRATISATGIVTSLPGATLSIAATQPARIAEMTKNVGDAVKSGEVLVRFEFPSLRAQMVVSEAAVKSADLRVKQAQLAQGRIRMLLSKGAASRNELDHAEREITDAQAELALANAALSTAQAQGSNAIIRAPFDGTVTERLHNPGDTVRADENDPILRIIDPKQVQVTVTLPVADAARFVIGATARAIAEGLATREQVPLRPMRSGETSPPTPDTAAVGRRFGEPELLRVATRPAPETGAKTVEVTLAFDTPTELKPGTQVAVEIDAEQRTNVPLVPAIAVLKENPDQPVVVVAAGSVAQRRPVVIGLVDGENIEILSGLKPGELIITQGHSTLRDGTSISVSAP
jgi:RND family efflux transporter MFP subunit